LSETFFIPRRNEGDIIISTYTGLRVKYPLFWSDFIGIWTLSTDFRKILLYQIPWK